MRNGRCPSSAAGRPAPGNSPVLAPINPLNFSRFGTLNLHLPPLNLATIDFAQTPSNRHTAISNRHLVQLEINTTSTESTRSLFLIVPTLHICPRGIACRAGCPPTTSRSAASALDTRADHVVSISNRRTAKSNRHFVRLEINATSTESTRSLFLIVPSLHLCLAVSITSQKVRLALDAIRRCATSAAAARLAGDSTRSRQPRFLIQQRRLFPHL